LENFNDLGLSSQTLKSVEQMGFKSPTPIQIQAIPYLLQSGKRDLVGLAQTGTGKTAAFGLPLIEQIDVNNNQIQALILSPTRELGQQTAQQIKEFSKGSKMNSEIVYGGTAITNQIRALKKPTQLVVATPGRLLDLIRRKALSLKAVEYVVLDEADELLNMGFQEDIDQILSSIDKDYSLWLFSATMPSGIRKIIKSYMKDPYEISVKGKDETNTDIDHQFVMTSNDNKLPALKRIVSANPEMKGILFCRTKRDTEQVAADLSKAGYNVEALHGDLSQKQRDVAMNRFKSQKVQLLVATDVAARGIDVSELSHVMHHKLPDQLEAYTHRSGRTGRAGNKGVSLAFINNREGRKITDLEKKLKIKFQQYEVPSHKEVEQQRLEKWVTELLSNEDDGTAYQSYQKIKHHFDDISKEELITKLISREIGQLSKSDQHDLNMSSTRGGERSNSRKERSEGRDDKVRAENLKYQINLGYSDGLKKGELVQFLVDMSGINRKDVGDIHMDQNKAVFEILGKVNKNFEMSFKGVFVGDDKPLELRLMSSGRGRSPKGKSGKAPHRGKSASRSDSPSKGGMRMRGRNKGKGRNR
jgi:ATP-dependent RNA helicase DeaD